MITTSQFHEAVINLVIPISQCDYVCYYEARHDFLVLHRDSTTDCSPNGGCAERGGHFTDNGVFSYHVMSYCLFDDDDFV